MVIHLTNSISNFITICIDRIFNLANINKDGYPNSKIRHSIYVHMREIKDIDPCHKNIEVFVNNIWI